MAPNNKTGQKNLAPLPNITPKIAPKSAQATSSGGSGGSLPQPPVATASIGPLGPGDLGSVAKLEKQCFALPWSLAEYQQALQNQTFGLLGLKENKQLVAYVSFYILQGELEIVNLATSAQARRQGYARSLLTALFEHAASQGAARIVLEVNCRNTPACNLYTALGFKQVGLRKGYYNQGRDDALIYERYLTPNAA